MENAHTHDVIRVFIFLDIKNDKKKKMVVFSISSVIGIVQLIRVPTYIIIRVNASRSVCMTEIIVIHE